MPESLPQGKSSFLSKYPVRKGIELQIDFIDSKGNSIYVEPYQLLRRNIKNLSVEVYIMYLVATMIIVGELEGLPINAVTLVREQIPDEFKGVYNVRLLKR